MSWFSDLLRDFPAVEVARERIALLEAKFSNLEANNAKLTADNERLLRENGSLRRQLPAEQFAESRGVLFKRKADGTFEEVAYCPDCRALSPRFTHLFHPVAQNAISSRRLGKARFRRSLPIYRARE